MTAPQWYFSVSASRPQCRGELHSHCDWVGLCTPYHYSKGIIGIFPIRPKISFQLRVGTLLAERQFRPATTARRLPGSESDLSGIQAREHPSQLNPAFLPIFPSRRSDTEVGEQYDRES